MHGDELVSLLGEYVTGLEKLALQVDTGGAADSKSLESMLRGGGSDRKQEDTPEQWMSRELSPNHLGVRDQRVLGGFEASLPLATIADAFTASENSEGYVTDMVRSLAEWQIPSGVGNSAWSSGVFGPALTALVDAFGNLLGRRTQGEHEFPRYVWETPTSTVEGMSGGRLTGVDTGYDGLPRQIEPLQQAGNRIDVRIEALDARSFLDRKEDIAEAVRQAMMTSGVLGGGLTDY